jgi:hypothetical protein
LSAAGTQRPTLAAANAMGRASDGGEAESIEASASALAPATATNAAVPMRLLDSPMLTDRCASQAHPLVGATALEVPRTRPEALSARTS